jgi:signal transduction histidine kinase
MSSVENVIEFPALRAGMDRAREDDIRRAAAAERLRIARELHDVIAFGFGTIKVHAGVALHVLNDAPDQLAGALRAIDAASKEALGELYAILGMLRTADDTAAPQPGPGVDRLDDLAASMTAAGVPTQVVVVGPVRTLPPAVDLTAFRIAQESLSNVLRHAGSTSAVVTLAYERDCVTVQVENGEGEEPDGLGDAPHDSGHGIVGMRERVAAVGGSFEAGLRPDGGFRVFARLPLFVRP